MEVWVLMLVVFTVFAVVLAARVFSVRKRSHLALAQGTHEERTGWGSWDLVAAAGAGLSFAGLLLSVAYAEELRTLVGSLWQ